MRLRSCRYTLAIEDRWDYGRRLTVNLRLAGLVLSALVVTPVLIGLGAKWSAHDELERLRSTNAALEIENGNFRATTGELTTQIQALENVLNDLGARAALDPSQVK